MKSLHSLLSIFVSGVSHEDTNGASSSSFFVSLSSPVVSSQAFGVDHIPFLVFNAFSCWCNSQSFTSLYSIVPECSNFLKRFVLSFKILSRSFEDVISFKSFNSTDATSLLNHFNAVSFEWALTHRSIPRILPDSSYFPELFPNSFPSLT